MKKSQVVVVVLVDAKSGERKLTKSHLAQFRAPHDETHGPDSTRLISCRIS